MPPLSRPSFPLFSPRLAGASLRDRLVACAGAAVGVGATAAVVSAFGTAGALALMAPIGASGVLAFALPASPLAQPWPVVGGNLVSALVGVGVAALVPGTALAAGVAVAAAILAMSLARCLHPPGGAVALLAVLGTQSGQPLSLALVGLNSLALVSAAWAFHRAAGHAYPHRANADAAARELEAEGLSRRDVECALADFGETFDIAPEDLELLLARAEYHAAERRDAERVRPRELRRAA